jgi:hypothetical protein
MTTTKTRDELINIAESDIRAIGKSLGMTPEAIENVIAKSGVRATIVEPLADWREREAEQMREAAKTQVFDISGFKVNPVCENCGSTLDWAFDGETVVKGDKPMCCGDIHGGFCAECCPPKEKRDVEEMLDHDYSMNY